MTAKMKDEWVEQKPDSQQPGIAELVENVGPSRRVDPRLYFHDNETPLEQQSTGVPVLIQAPGLLFRRQLGRGIVKDLSVGGVGFIASSRLELPPRVLLLLDDCPPLYCEILHRRPVVPLLYSYGACWYRSDRKQLEAVMARWLLAQQST